MSKWIDADEFLKEYCEPYPHVYKAMSRAMADAPSIDIVRCRECKYAEVYDGYYTQVCCENGVIGGHGELWNPDDFCSYGERKESE